MTLKCWTSAVRQTQQTSTNGMTGGVSEMQRVAAQAPTSLGSARVAYASSASTASSTTLTPATSLGGRSRDAGRRRSVGFILTTSTSSVDLSPVTAPARLSMTPTRNYYAAIQKTNRGRSLSSTWEATDSDDDEDDDEDDDADREEKAGDRAAEQSRRELVFTPMTTSSSNTTIINNNQTESTTPSTQATHTPRRRGSRGSRSRRRRTMSESTGTASNSTTRPVRILAPASSKTNFGGWVRGQPAEVRWEVVDKSVQCVRIDVCNVAWSVPTTIAQRVPNDGHFEWRRVYWGMPITDGYYINIYDVTDSASSSSTQHTRQQTHDSRHQQHRSTTTTTPNHYNRAADNQQDNGSPQLVLLARSERFAVIG